MIDEDTLSGYCTDGTFAGTHPDHHLPGIDFSTGSLGHGLSFGTGAAGRAAPGVEPRGVRAGERCRVQRRQRVGGGDVRRPPPAGELVAIVDVNGQQALDYTDQVLDCRRWATAGGRSAGTRMWSTATTPRHAAARWAGTAPGAARGSRANGVRQGRLVHGAEIKWHYMPMSDDEYRQALDEVTALSVRKAFIRTLSSSPRTTSGSCC